MGFEAKIYGFKLAVIILTLSSCGVNPVDTNYGNSNISSGGGSIASPDISDSVDYTSSGNRVAAAKPVAAPTPMAMPLTTQTAIPQNNTGVVYMPAQAYVQSGGAYFPIAGSSNTTVNGVPVTINNPQPYSSLSASDQQVIRKNVFGVAQQQPTYVIVPAAQPVNTLR